MFDATTCAFLAALGLVAGWVGGLMGVGGSVIMIPALALGMGPSRQHLYQAAALIVNVVVAIPSAHQHARAGATLGRVLRWTVPSAAAAAVVGVFVSDLPIFRGSGQGYLQILFGGFLLYVALYNGWRLRSGVFLPDVSDVDAARIAAWKLVVLIGLPAGFVGGLLGIGGGALAVPFQQVFLRIPLRRAIANSATTIVLTSAIAAIAKNSTLALHGESFATAAAMAGILAPTAFVGAWFGAAQVHRWPRRLIRIVFVLFAAYAAWRLIRTGWKSAVAHSALATANQAEAIEAGGVGRLGGPSRPDSRGREHAEWRVCSAVLTRRVTRIRAWRYTRREVDVRIKQAGILRGQQINEREEVETIDETVAGEIGVEIG